MPFVQDPVRHSDRRMNDSPTLDDEAGAELPCYLVVGQLVARARTGEWLRTDHLVELLSIWARGNGTQLGWLERVQLGHLSEQVASRFAGNAMFADPTALAKLFTNG